MLHFEGKIWRTLPMLAWHPGRADARVHRRAARASYVSPDRAVPVLVFLIFAVFNALGTTDKWAEGIQNSTTVDTASEIAGLSARIGRLQSRLAREEDADDRAELNRRIADLTRRRDALKTGLESGEPGLDINARAR